MAKRKRILGNVLILAGLFAIAGVLIVVLPALFRVKQILPPESPEVTARRFAPENAFYLLAEASSLLPKAPDFLMIHPKDDPRQTEKYQPEPGSIGRLLGISRPDDDPEMMAYLEACEPAVAKTFEALKRPYFLVPVDWTKSPSMEDQSNTIGKLNGLYRLGGLLAARGLQAARAGDGANALNGILDQIRLLFLVQGEWQPHRMFYDARVCVYEMARGSTDAALEAAAAELQRLRTALKPPTDILTFQLREVQCGAHFYEGPGRGNPAEKFFYDVVRSMAHRRVRDWIAEHRDELYAVIAKPMPEIREWTRTNSRDLQRRLWGDTQFLQGVEFMGTSAANTRVLVEGSMLVVALERYRRAEGGYPETLGALVPKYVETVPSDLYASGPLLYKRVDGDYQLYSVGQNQKDDGGGAIPEGRIVPQGDDVVVHWPSAKAN